MRILLILAFLFPAIAFAQVPDATLTWNDNSGIITPTNCSPTTSCDQETGFEIQRNLNGGAFTKIGATTAANINTVIDATRVAGAVDNTYCYRVRAVNAAGASAFTNVACATAIPAIPTIPAAASNLVVTP